MGKKILIFFLILLILALGYLLGTYRIDKKFDLSLNKQVTSKVVPTITPTPAIDVTNFIKVNDKGLITYDDPTYGASFQYPSDFTISGSHCNIEMEKYYQVIHGSTGDYLQVAVIPKLKPVNCDWVVYQGQEQKYQSLSKLDVGKQISTSDTMADFFTYKRLPNQILGKNQFKHFVSYKVWESSENTHDHVFQLETDKYTVWITGLTNESTIEVDAIPYKTFENIVSSFSIN